MCTLLQFVMALEGRKLSHYLDTARRASLFFSLVEVPHDPAINTQIQHA